MVAVGFIGLIAMGTFLLSLPVSSASGEMTPLLSCWFTATSAVSLTGLVVLDTGSHWSLFGQIIVVTLIQFGGFGIMSLTSLAGMLLTGRLGLRSRMNAAAEGRTLTSGGVRKTLASTLLLTAVIEIVVATILTIRFLVEYDFSFRRSVWEGIFHAISAFNNAGFGLRSDSLVPYVGDGWIIIPIGMALVIGGLGFPVLAELAGRARRRLAGKRQSRRLSVTAVMTLGGASVLITIGILVVAIFEWNGAMEGLSLQEKILGSWFQGVTPRTAGFNSIDYGEFHPITLMATNILMFIGGGSAGTAGGIKITTAVVLVAAMAAEIKGEKSVIVARRQITTGVVRQAMTVAAAGITVVTLAIAAIRFLDPQFTGDQVMFEVVSAFATVGLSTGITSDLSGPSQVIIITLMYLGRIGPITLVSALAFSSVRRRYTYPVERPFIG